MKRSGTCCRLEITYDPNRHTEPLWGLSGYVENRIDELSKHYDVRVRIVTEIVHVASTSLCSENFQSGLSFCSG